MATMSYTETLTVTHCWCGIALAIPDNLFRQAYDNGRSVYCPLGHTFSWYETEADRLRKELECEKGKAERAEGRADFWHKEQGRTERKLVATKGVVTRTKNRISKGVCPCCHRCFEQLSRHMKGQHPNYTSTDG